MKKTIYLLLFVFSFSICNAQTMTDSAVNATLKEANQYLKGQGKPKSAERAFILIKQCADAGNAKGYYGLAFMYAKGLGVNPDGKQAILLYTKAAEAGIAAAWCRIGYLYKTGINGLPDYEQAYNYYCKAADLNDRMGLFEKGYMLYTGFGCKQNYAAAYPLFYQAALAGNPHGMRLVGLSMRNGYGTQINTDSAMYWLRMASKYGKGMSDDELASAEPENADIAGNLIEKVKAAEKIMNKGNALNKYTMVKHSMPVGDIEGNYEGWLLKYDWSGQHVVKADRLNIEMAYENNMLTGSWTENDIVTIPLTAMLTPKALIFSNMQYSKNDHYYKTYAELLSFDKAGLQLIKNNDTVYLCGNLQMYSETRQEPAKPMYVALIRTAASKNKANQNILFVNEDGSPIILKNLNAYPNPFNDIITLDFELKESCIVQTKLQTMEGKLVYENVGGKLEVGNYTLPIKAQYLAAGTYLLTLQYGKRITTLKVVKL